MLFASCVRTGPRWLLVRHTLLPVQYFCDYIPPWKLALQAKKQANPVKYSKQKLATIKRPKLSKVSGLTTKKPTKLSAQPISPAYRATLAKAFKVIQGGMPVISAIDIQKVTRTFDAKYVTSKLSYG